MSKASASRLTDYLSRYHRLGKAGLGLISKESEEYIAKWADAYSFVVGLGQTEVDIDENKAYPVTISEDNALPFKLMYVDRNIDSKIHRKVSASILKWSAMFLVSK